MNKQKGNAVLIGIIAVAFVILAVLVWHGRKNVADNNMPASDNGSMTNNSGNTNPSTNPGTSTNGAAAGSVDFGPTDQNLNQLDQDQADIDSSINDKPVQQDY